MRWNAEASSLCGNRGKRVQQATSQQQSLGDTMVTGWRGHWMACGTRRWKALCGLFVQRKDTKKTEDVVLPFGSRTHGT